MPTEPMTEIAIAEEEIRESLKKLKINKSPGPEEMYPIFYDKLH